MDSKVGHEAAEPVRLVIALLLGAVGSLSAIAGAWLVGAGGLGAAMGGTGLMAFGVLAIALAFEA